MRKVMLVASLWLLSQTALAQTPGGGFTKAWDNGTEVGASAWDVEYMGDLDQDGKPEVMFCTDENGATLYLYENQGDDDWALVWTFNITEAFWSLTITTGDVDQDGLPEIYAGVRNASATHFGLWIFEWDGVAGSDTYGNGAEPTFKTNFNDVIPNPSPYSLRVLDIDGDGKVEIIAGDEKTDGQTEGTVLIMELTEGDLTFPNFTVEYESTGKGYGDFEGGIDVRDFDNDGNMEVALSAYQDNQLIVIRATGEDTYEEVLNLTLTPGRDGRAHRSLRSADWDGDGRFELYYAAEDMGEVLVITNDGDMAQVDSTNVFMIADFPSTVRGADVGDLDGDGEGSYYIAGHNNFQVFDLEFTGTDVTDSLSYTLTTIYDGRDPSGYGGFQYQDLAVLGDADGDGKRELAVINVTSEPYLEILEAGNVAAVLSRPEKIPTEYALHQNFPNPFNPSTDISYELVRAGEVTLEVYDLLGRRVKTLVSGFKGIGRHHTMWDGTNEQGVQVSSGVYVYTLRVNGFVSSRKMTLMR
jgi:hypothetical protein